MAKTNREQREKELADRIKAVAAADAAAKETAARLAAALAALAAENSPEGKLKSLLAKQAEEARAVATAAKKKAEEMYSS